MDEDEILARLERAAAKKVRDAGVAAAAVEPAAAPAAGLDEDEIFARLERNAAAAVRLAKPTDPFAVAFAAHAHDDPPRVPASSIPTLLAECGALPEGVREESEAFLLDELGRRGVPALVLAQAEEVHAALLAFQRGDDCADPSEHALRFPRVDDAIAGGDGHTPLVHAVVAGAADGDGAGDAAAVETLLRCGAQPGALSPADGTTALYEACARGARRAVAALCRGGADPDRPTARRGAVKAPLHIAAHRGHAGAIDELAAAHASIDAAALDGSTALSTAAKAGHADAVGVLLRARADATLATNKGYTPLWRAAAGGHSEVVALSSPTLPSTRTPPTPPA